MSRTRKRVSESQARKFARAVKMFLLFLMFKEPALRPLIKSYARYLSDPGHKMFAKLAN